jgi:histidine phosphotransferase ChpT
MNYLSFAQMLCSRLCHDLITPIGAVSTGIELLENCNRQDRAQLLAISQQSADTAARRLVYYRAAFGYSMTSQLTTLEEIEKLMTGFLDPLNIRFEWQEKPSDLQPLKELITFAAFARILLNLILIAAESSPFGSTGQLSLRTSEETVHLTLKVTGKLVVLRPEIQAALQGELEESLYTPRTIQPVMTHILLKNEGIVIEEMVSTSSELLIVVKKEKAAQSYTARLF